MVWEKEDQPAKRRGGGEELAGRQTSYLLYLTGDGVFLKQLTMRDGGRKLSLPLLPLPAHPMVHLLPPVHPSSRKCLMPWKVRRGN